VDSDNEIIISASDWDAHLPDGVAAFVYGAAANPGEAQRKHQSFLSHFGRTAAQTPLLRLDTAAVPVFSNT